MDQGMTTVGAQESYSFGSEPNITWSQARPAEMRKGKIRAISQDKLRVGNSRQYDVNNAEPNATIAAPKPGDNDSNKPFTTGYDFGGRLNRDYAENASEKWP